MTTQKPVSAKSSAPPPDGRVKRRRCLSPINVEEHSFLSIGPGDRICPICRGQMRPNSEAEHYEYLKGKLTMPDMEDQYGL